MFHITFVQIAEFDWLLVRHIYRVNFRKKYSKFFLSETIRRMKLKLGILVYDTTLYKSYVFLFSMYNFFRCYDNLKFPLRYNGKSGN